MLVGVGIGRYEDDHLDELPQAVRDVEEVAECFRAAGFSSELVLDKSREVVVEAIDDALPEGGLKHPGTVLVLIWTGHGESSRDTGSLQLLATDNRANSPDLRAVTADQVAQIAARTGASQMLLIIDACHSGSAVIDVARVVDAVRRKISDQKHRWVGILASCQDYEHARDGALAKKLVELLNNGPAQEALQLRWNSYQAGIRGDDLIDALVKEWDEERQQPKQNLQGDAQPILPNPLYQPDAPEQVVEHLLWAARGGGQSEVGIWFTGRVGPLRELVGVIRAGGPGLCVITGPAGCGKSAVAGRVVSLSNPEERTKIEAGQSALPSGLDPGESSIDAHLQARGATLERCSEQLGRALGVTGRGPELNHHELLGWASNQTEPPILVVDGLDEAGVEGFRIASELLEPLAQYALVIVATREIPGDDKQPSLLDSLGASLLTIDLEEDPGETDRDVDDYVVARLTDPDGRPVAEAMDPALVADEVVRLARADSGAPEGAFLLARILTSQLMERPVDTSAPDWQAPLSASVEEAFARDVSRGRPLERDGEELPRAARELLSALAYSYGPGFPTDDVWPAVASALSETDTSYNRLDAFWALGQHGRYVTASSLDGQAVYRLHQRLTEALRESEGSGAWRKVKESTGAVIAQTLMKVYEEFIEAGGSATEHPYLWRYAWLHATDGGEPGIEALARLADTELSLRPDLAMALNNLGNRYSEVGRRADAVAPTERAVEIYEQLAAENPAFLNDLASSLNNLGIRYSEVDRRADAVAPTERAAKIYEQLAAENPAFLNDLASSLNNLGIRFDEVENRSGGRCSWNAALQSFAEDPYASVVLRLRRLRSEDELDEAIADVLQAVDSDPGDDPRLTAEVHRACWSVRAKHQERFDLAWQERAGDLPSWLLLDNETLVSCAEWLDTNTWAESRDYLLGHADQLLTETAMVALGEIALAMPNDSIVSRHEALLEACRRGGADSAYRSLLIADTVREWRSLTDPKESRKFLLEHRDELLTDEASTAVAQVRDMRGQALLGLALADETELAYAILEGREPSTEALADARRHRDSDQLHFVAALCLTAADDDAQRAQAAVHLAMSLAMAGRGDEGSSLIHEACKAGHIPAAIDDLTDAISYRTQDAASLANLIRALPGNEAQDEAR
jgi:tetratricopeptide (TPR) repeat protein